MKVSACKVQAICWMGQIFPAVYGHAAVESPLKASWDTQGSLLLKLPAPMWQEWMHTATAQHWSTWRKQSGWDVLSYLELKWHSSMIVATLLHPMSQRNSWSSWSLALRLVIFISLDQRRKISNERNFNMKMVWKMRCTGERSHRVQSTRSHPAYTKLASTSTSHYVQI